MSTYINCRKKTSLKSPIRIIKGFLKLSFEEKKIFVEAYILLAAISILVEIVPFRWFAGKLGKHMQETTFESNAQIDTTARNTGSLIYKSVRFIPWKIKCLTQAITGKFILKRRGIISTLYLGVKKSESKKLEAHAWLRVGNKIITGKEVYEEFTIVSYFGK